ncbi:PAS domain-containing protein [Methanococcoides sp. NM1]|uniref:PAS domain-containing sensor histidine kinase n=1 Tax=Methanococcoides sp. NM1 TaxID=1201013 RepID=UPI0010844411|nr:PAS domain-containing protein [Methanococcoides sp. NM1]
MTMKNEDKTSEKIEVLEKTIKELRDELELVNKEAREKEEFYKLHLDNLNDVIFSIDKEGNFTYISSAIENFTGYVPEEVIGTAFIKYIHPEDLSGLLDDMDLTLKGEHKPYMFRVIAKSGKITHVHTSSKGIVRNGEVIGLNGIMVNIDQLKKVEFELMKEKEKAQHYLNVSNVIFVALDRNQKISLVNRKAVEILGYSEKELLGSNWLNMFIPENIYDNVEGMFNTIMSGDIEQFKYYDNPIITRSGEERIISWNNSILYDNNGNISGLLASGIDVTEKKVAEKALLSAKLEAETANQAKTIFIANMSHELRTPLNSVIGFSEILLEKKFGDINEKQEKYINNIYTSGRRLLGVFNLMLEVSNVESEVAKLDYKTIELRELIDTLRKYFITIVLEKKQALSFNINTDIKYIIADIEKVEQSLINLIDNASKFSKNGSLIKVDIQNTDKDIVFKVSDKGIGISEENMDQLFNPFTQIDPSSTRAHGGMGLGLSLAKKYSELHGGSLNVRSELNKGSSFTFIIPLKPEINTTDLSENDKI